MRKGWVLVMIGLSAPCPTLRAAEERPYITPVNYPTPTPAGFSINGEITNIDPVNRMIQVREASGMVQTIRITENIQVLHNGQPVNFNTLSLGDTVVVRAN